MKLEIPERKLISCQLRLDRELNDFVTSVAKDLSCSKSEAIRAMIKVCKNANWRKEK